MRFCPSGSFCYWGGAELCWVLLGLVVTEVFFFLVTEVLPTLPLLQQPLMQDPHPLVMQPLVQDPHHHYPLVTVKQLNLVQFPYHPMIQEESSYDLSCAGSATT